MGELLRLPVRRPPVSPETELVLLDRTLADVEETLDGARGWLPRLTGWVREQALLEIARLEEKRRWLAARRLRVAGAELALLKGGKS